jgi:predicted ATPase
MSITVTAKNFGPIANGTVTLLPFNVFIGPNNTGKSFMSTLIYAAEISRRGRRLAPGLYMAPVGTRLPQTALTDLRRYIQGYLQVRNPDLRSIFTNAPKEVKAAIKQIVRNELYNYSRAVTAELERCLGGTIGDLVRVSRVQRSAMELSIASDEPPWRVGINCNGDKINYRTVRIPLQKEIIAKVNAIALETIVGMIGPTGDDADEESDTVSYLQSHPYYVQQMTEEISSAVARSMVSQLANYLYSSFPADRHYLPAARSGIMQSHKSLAEFLVRSAPLVGLQQMSIPQLSGTVTDFISQLLNLDFGRTRDRPDRNLEAVARSLENSVLHGHITVKAEPNTYPEILYQAGELQAPLVRLSSMISELAPVVLYIRYVLKNGSHLIIEEPEAHLHPQSQREFAHALASLRACGVIITLTTHSDYLLTEINNLIRQRSIAHAKGVPDLAVSIPYTDVAAYLFRSPNGESGTTIRRLQISEMDGIPDEEFGKVADAIYNDAADLEYRLLMIDESKKDD